MISRKQLHEKTLPEEKKKYVQIDYVSFYLWRPICDYVTILLLDTKITATLVTILSFYACLAALCVFIAIPGMVGALLGYFFLWIWNISDGVDGNLARYRDECTRAGDLWDATAGYLAMFVFYYGAGIVAAHESSQIVISGISAVNYVEMGAIAGACTILPRLVVHKKDSVYGNAQKENLKDRTSFGIIKIIGLNLVSINGFAGLLFLLCVITRTVNLFMTCYVIIMLSFATVTMRSTLRKLN